MTGEFEAVFREMLRSVALEAASEAIRQQRVLDEEKSRDGESDRFLLRSHEAAERLAISPASLSRITRSGELPSLRVGRTIRYSTETIREWIREREAAPEAPPQRNYSVEAAISAAQARLTPSTPSKSKNASSPSLKPKQHPKAPIERVKPRRKVLPAPDKETRPNPFSLLLHELGVTREDFPPLTNGDLTRIAESDTVTMHGWIHLGRDLPDAAMQKLREHFGQYRNK